MSYPLWGVTQCSFHARKDKKDTKVSFSMLAFCGLLMMFADVPSNKARNRGDNDASNNEW